MGFGSWFEDRAEIKAAERKAFEKTKAKAHAEKQRVAIDAAKVAGKERAYSGRKLPKPNPEKIAAIKTGLSKMADKAAKAGERMKATGRKAPAKKIKSLEEEMNDYNKKMKDTLGL